MKDRITTVALVANVLKAEAKAACGRLSAIIRAAGARVVADLETAALLGEPSLGRDDAALRAEAGLVVAVGGDGTVLKAARAIAGAPVPLIGINLGGLGFLTAASLEGAGEAIGAALRGECRAEERMLLRVALTRGGHELARRLVVNDAVVAKGALARLVSLETWIDGDNLVTFMADGLIIASPTGSTAYSLSAGGPLVSPAMDAIIVSPICPHMLTNRPLVVPGGSRVRIGFSGRTQDCTLTLDGQASEVLSDGDEITVERARERLTLLASPGTSFYRLLREKLHWGGRASHGPRHH